MGRTFRMFIVIFAFCGLAFPGLLQAKTYQLTGSQKAGSIAGGPKIAGKALQLKKPAVITRIDCKAFVIGEKEHRVEGILPPGRYVLKTSAGNVTIHLDDQAKPKALVLWAKQKKGPNHWIKRNTVVLGVPYLIADYRYKGTNGGTISPIRKNRISSKPDFRFISAHNKRDKGPAYFGPRGKKLKTLKGKIVGPGAYVCTPGLGTADHIVSLEVQLVPQ